MTASEAMSVSEITESENVVATPDDLARTAECIRSAAQHQPQMPDFFNRLKHCGVRAEVRFSRTGRVRQFFYRNGRCEIVPSKLGSEFTWSGLQKKLGVQFDRRDHQVVLEHMAATVDAFVRPSVTSTPSESVIVNSESSEPNATALTELKTLEDRMCKMIERMREQQALGIRNDLAQLHGVFVKDIAEEFAKLRDQELLAVRDAVAPLGDAVNKVRSDVQAVMTHIEQDHNAPSPTLSEPNDIARQLALSIDTMDLTTAKAVRDSHRAVKNADLAITKMRKESLWLALSAALVSALLASLVTGLWVSQSVESQVEQARVQIIEHMDKQAADDPLRNYFNRLMEKLSR